MIGTTITDLLTLKVFQNAKVLAGKDKLDRIVSTVTVAEVPDIINWAKKNTLYLTTLYSFQEAESQKALINGLHSKQASGLVIKTGRFLNEEPSALISEAERLNFPVIEIEKDIRWSDLIRAIFEKIIENENKNNLEEKFVSMLLGSRDLAEDELESIAEELNLNIKSAYGVAILHVLTNEKTSASKLSPSRKSLVLNKAKKIFGELQNHKLQNHYVISWTHKSLVAITSETNIEKIKEKLSKLIEFLKNELPGYEVFAGIGPLASSLLEIKNSIDEARRIVEILKKIRLPFKPVPFEEVEELVYLDGVAHLPGTKEFIKRTLGVLLKENKYNELLKTLEIYLACDRNKVKTADNLMIHLNTLKYRIKKIESLLGESLDSPETAFKLQLALKLHKLI